MANIALNLVTKKFDDVTALDRISFDIPDSSFVTLLGPTGAGKTTTLRCIAGLERPDEGEILIDGKVTNEIPPSIRDVAFVSQHYALYPHYTVRDNLLFPLRPRRMPAEAMAERVKMVTRILHIEHLLDRKPDKLSGGEMQRVAIGRAMVREPRLFLMDEPLSNLDAKLREELRYELKRLQKEMGATILFVTHDQIEALSMAESIVVLYQGKVQQIGAPKEIYSRPANTFVARFVGSPGMNLIEGVIGADAFGPTGLPESLLPLPSELRGRLPQGKALLGVRPEDVEVGPDNQPGMLPAEIFVIESLGVEKILDLRIGSQTLKARIAPRREAMVGQLIRISMNPGKIRFFSPDGSAIPV